MKFKGKVKEPNRVKENVWDPKASRVIAVIENGVYETGSEDVIQKLKSLGYEEYVEPEAEVIEKDQSAPMTRPRKKKTEKE
jgi:hypothetical protein